MVFAWDETNLDHIAKHGVTPIEAMVIVENASPPFPQEVGGGKRRVWGATAKGRLLQVIYVLKKQEEISFESVDPSDWKLLEDFPEAKIVRIIHAMDLSFEMKRQLRRRRR